jgi:nucleoside-diphosphate-sugar epimerase
LRVLIFGSDGFLGSNFASNFEQCGFHVFPVNRSVFAFGEGHEQARLGNIIEDFSPNLIVNALGQIDGQVGATPVSIFASVFLPTFSLFNYFQTAEVSQQTTILTFGSEAEGQPRKNYPIYSALKTAEATLILTANEYFADTNLRWLRLKLPRLVGGLGLAGVSDLKLSDGAGFEFVWREARLVLGLNENFGEVDD